jgi:glycosyltransferase involved in cell wall biosynthesis
MPSDKRLSLAFLCAGDPLNVRTWSGTPAYMLEALKSQFDVVKVVREPWPKWFVLARRAIRRLTKGSIDLYWSPFWTRIASAGTVSEIEKSGCDVVFAAAVTPICAQLVTRFKTVFVSDATQSLIANYYPHHARLAPSMKAAAAALETRCIAEADLSLFPSDWAANSAIRDHGGSPGQVMTVPWGANLAATRVTPPETRSTNEWRLLFVGVGWHGKGGDIALKTVAEMRRRGHFVHLDVVGSAPSDPPPQIEGVTFHGFLDKNLEADRATLGALFSAAHAFFLPTRFEALGMVFAEAASYALPAISHRTGGIPGTVVDGETGLLLEEGASPEAFATALIALFEDRPRYLKMARAALFRSQVTLNWTSWATRVSHALRATVAGESPAVGPRAEFAPAPHPAADSPEEAIATLVEGLRVAEAFISGASEDPMTGRVDSVAAEPLAKIRAALDQVVGPPVSQPQRRERRRPEFTAPELQHWS